MAIDLMNEALSKAVVIFRRLATLDDDDLRTALVAEGIDPALASRFIEFVPLAYGRFLLRNTGVRFPDSFQRRLPNGGRSELHPLTSEPVWNAAEAFARAEVERGQISPDDLMAIALRSAEVQAVNAALHDGAKLENLAGTSALLPALDAWSS